MYAMNLNNGTWGQLYRGQCAGDNWRCVWGNKAAGHLLEGNISILTYLGKGSLPDQRKAIPLVGFHGQKCSSKLRLNKSDPNHGRHLSFTVWKREGLRAKLANPSFWIRHCWRICPRRPCHVSEWGWVTWLFFEVFPFCQKYIIQMFVTSLTKPGRGQAWMTSFYFGILQWTVFFCQVVPSLLERSCFNFLGKKFLSTLCTVAWFFFFFFCPSKKTLYSANLKLY